MPAGPIDAKEWCTRAQAVARTLHRNDEVAAKVAANAMARFDSAAGAQRKRLYYVPSRQCKTYFPGPALLHMLVLAESEPFERSDECTRLVPESLLVTRYVKHLIFVGARRNSFHVALGVARLLFSYGTSETMKLYDPLLAPDEFLKEDYYYRARKRLLMTELQERFPALQRINVRRAEERFLPAGDQDAHVPLVLAALEACTPWGTSCTGGEGDLQRLHALVHPPCLQALAAKAGLDSPWKRLAVPALGTPVAGGAIALLPARGEKVPERRMRGVAWP